MKHIIVNFNIFDLNQDVYVYDNGACIEQTKVPLYQVTDIVAAFRNEYDIKQIDLYGNENFLSRFKAQMGTDFNFVDCDINIIQKN